MGVVFLVLFPIAIRANYLVRVPKALEARPPRPETGTGSGGATGCGYATVFTAYECLTFHHRILTCQVWARV